MGESVLKEIIKVLNSSNDFLSSQDLSFIVGISDRTIRYELNQNRELLEKNGISIISKPKLGYKLKVNNEFRAMDFIKNMDLMLGQEVGDVKYQILADLLFETDYLEIEELSERYYVSRSTVYRVIKNLEELLQDYDLELESKVNSGLLVVGRRSNRLRCLQDNCVTALLELRSMNFDDFKKYKKEITMMTFAILEERQFLVTESNSNSLIVHIMMMLELNDRSIDATTSSYWNLKEESIASSIEICKALEDKYNIEITYDNMTFVAVHLQAKQLVRNKTVESSEYIKVINNIIAKINRELGYNFINDNKLIQDLTLHFEPMIFRLKNNLTIESDLVDDIKLNLYEGYECGLVAAKVVHDLYDIVSNEAEVSLLALHFGVAIERITEQQATKVLLVSSDAAGIISLIKKRIIKELSVNAEDVDIASFTHAFQLDLEEYDLIFSTMPLAHRVNAKIEYISNPLTYQFSAHRERSLSVKRLDEIITEDDFYHGVDLASKEEVLDFINQELKSRYGINKFITQSVINREEMSTTEIANSVAIPHPSIRSEENIIMIIILKKPIKWKKKVVQCVVFVSHQLGDLKQERSINSSIADFVLNFDKVKYLLDNPNYENLIDIIA